MSAGYGMTRRIMNIRWLVALAVLLFCSWLPALAAAQDDNFVSYRVQRGDTLLGLERKYLRRKGDHRAVQRLNRIANDRTIPVGSTLKFPRHLLKFRPSEARISSFRGDAVMVSGGQPLPVSLGRIVAEGDVLTTARGSHMSLALEDGSALTLPSNTRLRVVLLRRFLLTDGVDIEFAVESGGIVTKAAPLRTQDRYRVRTPAAVSAVRGTEFRSRVGDDGSTGFAETIDGAVAVSAATGNAATLVPAGRGAAVAAGGELSEEDLLPPPTLIEPGMVQSEEALRFTAQPNAAARGYRWLIAADAGFVDIVADGRELADSIILPTIPNGRYFVRASALSSTGFEGLPATFAFKRQLSTLAASADVGDFGFRFKWTGAGAGERRYRLQIVPGAPGNVPTVDEPGLTSTEVTLSDLPNGDYFWRVGVTQFEDGEVIEKWTDFAKLTVAE
jgi:hypothetical protein